MSLKGCAIYSVVAVIGIALILATQPNVASSAAASGCRDNLSRLFSELYEYGYSHAEFPILKDGQLDLSVILASKYGDDRVKCLCTKNTSLDCYVFRKQLTPGDLTWDMSDENPLTIIAVDQVGNHAESLTNFTYTGDYHVNALLSFGGVTQHFSLSRDDHLRLIERLKTGEKIPLTELIEQIDG